MFSLHLRRQRWQRRLDHEVKEDGDEAAHEVGRLPERRQPEGAADNRVGADRDGLHVEAPVLNASSASAAVISSYGGSRRGMTDSERALLWY